MVTIPPRIAGRFRNSQITVYSRDSSSLAHCAKASRKGFGRRSPITLRRVSALGTPWKKSKKLVSQPSLHSAHSSMSSHPSAPQMLASNLFCKGNCLRNRASIPVRIIRASHALVWPLGIEGTLSDSFYSIADGRWSPTNVSTKKLTAIHSHGQTSSPVVFGDTRTDLCLAVTGCHTP